MPSIPLPFSNRSVSEWIAQLQSASDAEQRLVALQAIGASGSAAEASQWAIHSLNDNDPTVRALAAKLIGNIGSELPGESKSRLSLLLADQDPDVRFEAARTLIRRKSDDSGAALNVLMPFLDETETHPLMAAAVINAIVESDLDADTAVATLCPRLLKWIDHDRGEVREAVATAFAKWPSMGKSCIDRLLPLLDDSEPLVREKIAETLGRASTADERIRSALQAACDDEDTEVARVAAEALKRLTDAGEQPK